MSEIKNSVNQNKRVDFLDCTRALCMFYIVGIWHMLSGYVRGNVNIVNPFTEGITYGVLACFAMISGYFLGKKPIASFGEAMSFYKKRLLRIYPLFFVSCLSLLFMHYALHIDLIESFSQFVLTILGLSSFFNSAPSTIWFISMLLMFYALTPFVNWQKSLRRKVICILLITAVIGIIDIIFGSVDSRVWICWPFYCLGLIIGFGMEIKNRFNISVLIISAVVFIALTALRIVIPEIILVKYIFDYVITAAFIVFIFQIGMLCEKNVVLCRALKAISYASMASYLFHRQLFGAIKMLIGDFPIAVAYLIVLPITFILMYFVQLVYDKVVRTLIR